MYIIMTKNTDAVIAEMAQHPEHVTTIGTTPMLLIHQWDKIGVTAEEMVTALGDDFLGMLHVNG